MKKIFLCIAGIGIMLAACENEKDESDKASPTITMMPANHQTYDLGDTAFFHIEITDNDQLKEVHFLLESIENAEYINIHEFPGTKAYSIDTFFVMDNPDFQQVNFSVKASDPAGNSSEKSGHIHIR